MGGGTAVGGKSYVGSVWLVSSCMHFENIRAVAARKTLKSLKESTWNTIKTILNDWGLKEDVNYKINNLEGTLTPNCWGAIADYDSAYNDYELSDHEYAVYEGRVFYPETYINADVPELGNNLSLHDPRNYNLKKHMVHLAVYELTKLIAPNNISTVRMQDYEDSMKWLNNAAQLRLNPQIPRKVDETKKPVTDWQPTTFQNDYDPYRNPWMV